MIHISLLPLRMLAGLLLLSIMACNKLPNELPCGCEPDPPVYKKGGSARPLAVCGTLHLPIDSTQSVGVITVLLGFNGLGQYNLGELGPGKTVLFGEIPNFRINSVGYHFSITGVVSDLKHNPLVLLQDSKWFVYKNNIGRYNYDANGLEVYDKLGNVALSINGLKSETYSAAMIIQGIFPLSDSTVIYYELTDGLQNFPYAYGTPALNTIFYQYVGSTPIKPIFRYTGPNWQHARL